MSTFVFCKTTIWLYKPFLEFEAKSATNHSNILESGLDVYSTLIYFVTNSHFLNKYYNHCSPVSMSHLLFHFQSGKFHFSNFYMD
jgi:hypothetical protein